MSQLFDTGGNAVFTDVVQQTQTLSSLNGANNVQLRGQANVMVQITGSTGTNTIVFQITTDGTNFQTVSAYPVAGGAAVTSVAGGVNGYWWVPVTAVSKFQALMSAFTNGSAIVSVIAAQGSMPPSLTAAGNTPIDLLRWAGTALGTPTNFGTTPTAVVAGAVNSSTFIGTTVAVAASAGIQKVGISGNAGASVDAVSGAAVPANALLVAGGSIAGGTNTTPVTVKAASVAAAATDTALVVQALVNSAVMSTAAAGVQRVGIAGNANAALDAATSAAFPANALAFGVKAATANPTNATAGNLTAPMGDKAGRLVTINGHVRELVGVQTTVITASTAETTIIAAGGAGVFNDLTHISITTTNVIAAVITIKDSLAGTTRLTYEYPGSAAAPGALILSDFNPAIPQGTANAVWTATVSVNAGAVAINCVFTKNT